MFAQPRIQNATKHDLIRFAHFLEPNPRSMKLFVNTYGVLRSLRTIEEMFVDSGPLALWDNPRIRWPALADYLRAHPECLNPAESEIPEGIKALLIDPDVSAVINHESSGPLTADLVRQCSGTA